VQLLVRWPLPDVPDLGERLVAAYADERRTYHDLRHLTEVLDRLDELHAIGTPFDPVAVRLAAWFHDAVHEGRPGDEERSARWAEEALADAGVEAPLVAEVARLVRSTEHHDPAPDDLDGSALSDADLAILASPAQRYADYVADVRLEYAHVSDRDFAIGRTAVLRELLSADRLFRTDHGHTHWETAARRNVEADLAALDERLRLSGGMT
jgi:predicted metal-dependent HD superfamily phosphohydrolase